jgi:hypothetical protein
MRTQAALVKKEKKMHLSQMHNIFKAEHYQTTSSP